MKYQVTLRLLHFGTLLVLAFALAAQAQDKGAEKKDNEKKGGILSKVGIGKKDEETKAAEREQKYQELRAKAREKYDDPTKTEFKLRVNGDYKEKRREHSEYAFQINTFDTQDERITFTGDKLKTEDTLYDNPLVQDYVNRVGQSLVPPASPHRYAFKVVMNPVPDARSLSTGTVYITTGLLSLIDTEAQLAYILAHEVAHIEKTHWFEDALVANEMVDRERARDRNFALIGIGVGVLTGGLAGKNTGAANGVMTGLFMGGATLSLLKFVSSLKTFSWDGVQETEADDLSMKLMFDRNYDPREVPKLYARLAALSEREPRVGDGFLASTERIVSRVNQVNPMMMGWSAKPLMARGAVNLRSRRQAEAPDSALLSPLEAGKPFGTSTDAEKREKSSSKNLREMEEQLRTKIEKGEVIGSGPEFETVMADLKRDNGVRAFYYDMFQMALQNLSESLQIRSEDPYTAFYYGKVLQLTARNKAEQATAMRSFVNAMALDKRGVLPGPWLHRALGLMADRNPSQSGEIVMHLKRYVEMYQQEHSGVLPPNMDAIYAYLKTLGEDTWVARPVQNVSTKNIDPLTFTTAPTATPAPAPVRVVQPEPTPVAAPVDNKRKGKP
ncbi:MAG: M48 family metalloprotease [Acidobacteria bacterium]|nr:M48 family metalloprotease [Acidobacteriota bacterium]